MKTIRIPPEPYHLGAAIGAARALRGWTRPFLARLAGVTTNAVHRCEQSRRPPRALLARIVPVLPRPGEIFEAWHALVRATPAPPARSLPVEPDLLTACSAAARLAEDTTALLRLARPAARVTALLSAQESLQAAAALLERLRPYTDIERHAIVKELAEFHNPFLVLVLCDESVSAAPDSAEEALRYARLALAVARRVPGSDLKRAALEGYAWGFVGNALRVANLMPESDAAFSRSAALMTKGFLHAPHWLDTSRLLDLEASLRRDQRRLPEAFDLLDRALPLCRTDMARGRVLILRAKTFEESGDYEQAITTLCRAEPHVEAAGDLRLLWVFKANLVDFLHEVGRHAEAEALLPQVRELALRLGYRLDLLRLSWLEARCAVALDRLEQAVPLLEKVVADFTDLKQLPYDAALAGLELAALYLRQGKTAAVRALAGKIRWVFQGEGITREELASVTVFCKAAGEEKLSLELANRCLANLRRARRKQ
jgi:tetratricopeptide (TPR) repeat protein